MGSGQSRDPHTVTFENEAKAGPEIIITDDVRKRLEENFAEDTKSMPRNPRQDDQQPKYPVYSHAYRSAPPHSEYGYAASNYNMDAYRHTQDLLMQNDQYWRRSMEDMERFLQKTNTIMEQEFHNSYEKIQTSFSKPPPAHQRPPCENFKEQLFRCYNANPGKTLNCFQEVAAFEKCVNGSRVRRLDRKLNEDEDF